MVPTCLPSPGGGLLGQEWSPHVCPIPAEGNKLQGEGPPNQVQIVWTTFYHHHYEFCTISRSRDIRKSKLDIIIRNFRYWLILCLEI